VNPRVCKDVPEQTVVVVAHVPSKNLRFSLPRVLQIRPDRPGPIPHAHEQPISVVVWLLERDDAFAVVVLTHSVPVFARESSDVVDRHFIVFSSTIITTGRRIGIVVVVIVVGGGRIIHACVCVFVVALVLQYARVFL